MTYVDASAMAKTLVEEADSEAVTAYLRAARGAGQRIVSSVLLKVELRRLWVRINNLVPGLVPESQLNAAVGNVAMLSVVDEVLHNAERIEQVVKTLDALHLGSAVFLNRQDEVTLVTYDQRMAEVGAALGLAVRTPRAG